MEAHGTCAVVVAMKAGVHESGGTWLAVSLAASLLNMACVGTGRVSRLQGGWTTSGAQEGVNVTLGYFPSGAEGGMVEVS